MKRKLLYFMLLSCTLFSQSVNAANENVTVQQNENPGFNTIIRWKSTNAIDVKTSEEKETINNKPVTIQVIELTIPFFQEQFNGSLRLVNMSPVKESNFPPPAAMPLPCKQHSFQLFSAFDGGRVLASVNGSMELDMHQLQLPIGVSSLRTEASCTNHIYAKAFIRIKVHKETIPDVSVRLLLNNNPVDPSVKQTFVNDPVIFSLEGKPVNNEKLYLRVVPPCGLDCRKTDFLIDDMFKLSADELKKFYSCDADGIYQVKIIYKSDKVGGGNFKEEISMPNWTSYSFLHKTETTIKKEIAAESSKAITKWELRPNPVQDWLYVELPLSKLAQISRAIISDINGKQLVVQESNSAQLRIDLSKLAAGAYIIQVIRGDEKFTEKIIKL